MQCASNFVSSKASRKQRYSTKTRKNSTVTKMPKSRVDVSLLWLLKMFIFKIDQTIFGKQLLTDHFTQGEI